MLVLYYLIVIYIFRRHFAEADGALQQLLFRQSHICDKPLGRCEERHDRKYRHHNAARREARAAGGEDGPIAGRSFQVRKVLPRVEECHVVEETQVVLVGLLSFGPDYLVDFISYMRLRLQQVQQLNIIAA